MYTQFIVCQRNLKQKYSLQNYHIKKKSKKFFIKLFELLFKFSYNPIMYNLKVA